MKKILGLALVMLLLLGGSALASVGVRQDGAMVGQATDIDFKGDDLTVSIDGSEIDVSTQTAFVEESDTPDTITTAEGGTTFIATSAATSGKSFDLPLIAATTNDGLTYTFVWGPPGMNTDGVQLLMNVGAQVGNCIYYTSKGSSGASLTTGGAPADSYPSITLRAFGGDWYVTEVKGTWTAATHPATTYGQ